MRRIVTARQQVEMLQPWLRVADRPPAGRRIRRLPDVRADKLDELGYTQRKFNHNMLTWLDAATDEDKRQGALWYPVGHHWGQHMADRAGVHPDKVYGVMSKTSPQRKWISTALNGNSNLGDTHRIIFGAGQPELIGRLGGKSGGDNLRQALRVMGAPDHPDAIRDAFLGMDSRGRVRRPRDIAKTYDFFTALRDPESGGAYNYMDQPAVIDSWAGRSGLWTRDRWMDAHSGGRPLDYPGRGTGKGLDTPVKVKEVNPDTGQWEFTGRLKRPGATDIAARVIGYGGGYDRLRNAVRNAASVHDMPYSHEAQATIWRLISGNENPAGQPNPDLDLHSIDHPEHLYHEMWARHGNGLYLPQDPGFQPVHARLARLGDEDGDDEGTFGPDNDDWGTPQHLLEVQQHMAAVPPGWDPWEGAPAGPLDEGDDPTVTAALAAVAQAGRLLIDLGTARMAAMRELDWEKPTQAFGHDPDEVISAYSSNDDLYHVVAPWKHHEAPAVNGFGDQVESEHPEMWALIHRFEPNIGWEHQVTYHPTGEHAMGAAEHHAVTGDAPGRYPGAVPHSDYDPDRVESWPDLAEEFDNRDDDDDERPEEEWGDPEIPLNRGNGLKWRYNNYWKDMAPRYMADFPENPDHPAIMPGYKPTSYTVQGPHGPDNGLAHPEGSYSVRWHAPGWQEDAPRGYMTGEYQSNRSGRGYHRSLEDALRWAENHAVPRIDWNPDENPGPDDPRIKGAGRQRFTASGNEDDPAPEGVWTPPEYSEDGNYGPTGDMYGTHEERYLEDLYHGHLVDLDDQELIDAYEHQRKQPGFRGSDLENTMWTAVGNRVDNEADPVVNETRLEDMLHGTTTPDSPITDYFNKVHGCDEHMWTPPDLHEPHGNFGGHPEGRWNPDDEQDPFDPRLFGANRRAAGEETSSLKWEPHMRLRGIDGVDEWYHDGTFAASGNNGKWEPPAAWKGTYTIIPPDHKWNDSGMWGLEHAHAREGAYKVRRTFTTHPSREHAEMTAQYHHDTGTPTTEVAKKQLPTEEEGDWDEWDEQPHIEVGPGPHRVSIERHLTDEDYHDDWTGSDESYEDDPEMVHEMHPTGDHALQRLKDVGADWGCTVSEYPGEDRLVPGEEGVRYFKFNGPERGEVQGYAELRPQPVPRQDYRPGEDAYPQMNRSLLSGKDDPRSSGTNRDD
jgi:hypothetical protein